ncbi:uncharacterized protein [Hoplias malabaricus]|uniref:uncharacterized protein n=1 Tax=Hoplias malabaricus TaxID=27720 RepID=UPI0034627FA7
MWTLILLMTSLFPAGVNAVTTVTGLRGHSVQIQCHYESGYESYIKYLCRGECSIFTLSAEDIIVKSGTSNKDQKFSLKHDTMNRVFNITITDLRTEDAGKYWCAIERLLLDLYTEIQLQVTEVSGKPSGDSGRESRKFSTNTVYGGDGELLTSTGDIIRWWKKYLEDLLNPTSTSSTEEVEFGDPGEGSSITGAEVPEVSLTVLNHRSHTSAHFLHRHTYKLSLRVRRFAAVSAAVLRRSMNITAVTLTLLTVFHCVVSARLRVKAPLGGNVSVHCPYKRGTETYPKYFSKGSEKVHILREGKNRGWSADEKFSLEDDREKMEFTVTIRDLKVEDAGQYWCGVDTWGSDVLTEVNLDSCTVIIDQSAYLGACLTVVVLLCGIMGAIFVIIKWNNIRKKVTKESDSSQPGINPEF